MIRKGDTGAEIDFVAQHEGAILDLSAAGDRGEPSDILLTCKWGKTANVFELTFADGKAELGSSPEDGEVTGLPEATDLDESGPLEVFATLTFANGDVLICDPQEFLVGDGP